jgi:hypothetical protein
MATKGEPLYEGRIAEREAARALAMNAGNADSDGDAGSAAHCLEEAKNLGDEWVDNRDAEHWYSATGISADEMRFERRHMFIEDIYRLRKLQARPPRHVSLARLRHRSFGRDGSCGNAVWQAASRNRLGNRLLFVYSHPQEMFLTSQ